MKYRNLLMMIAAGLVAAVTYANETAVDTRLSVMLKVIDLSAWADYGASLKKCEPKIYNLPSFAAIMELAQRIDIRTNAISPQELNKYVQATRINYEIVGWADEICQVITTTPLAKGDPVINPDDAGNIRLGCLFPKDKLPVLIGATKEITKDASIAAMRTINAMEQQFCGPLVTSGQPETPT